MEAMPQAIFNHRYRAVEDLSWDLYGGVSAHVFQGVV
jgi:hypothetical protein